MSGRLNEFYEYITIMGTGDQERLTFEKMKISFGRIFRGRKEEKEENRGSGRIREFKRKPSGRNF